MTATEKTDNPEHQGKAAGDSEKKGVPKVKLQVAPPTKNVPPFMAKPGKGNRPQPMRKSHGRGR